MENGFTQLPNCFYKILPVLSESELKVIHVIIAHTIKWHKIMARITYNSFQKESGIYAEAVRKAIVSLQKKNLIIITKKFEYGVNWEYIRDTDEFQLKHTSIIDYNFNPDKYVYIIRYDTHVKIGKANNVQKRFSSLKGMSHTKIELLWYANETESINEQSLHALFNKHRSHNEYFEYSTEIKDFIESHRN